MTERIRAAEEQYQRQQRLAAMALAQARRTWETKNWGVLLALMYLLQRESGANALQGNQEMMRELGIVAPPVTRRQVGLPQARGGGSDVPVQPQIEEMVGWSSAGAPLGNMLRAAETLPDLQSAVLTELADFERITQQIDLVSRPEITGMVRYLNPPSCGRCAILAGRIYRWSGDFLRHPRCDCICVPLNRNVRAADFLTDPDEAVRLGQVKGLSGADMEAFRAGASLSDIVNVRRKAAGLKVAGRVLERGGRLTPEGIYRLSSSRDDALARLAKAGYLA